MMMCIWIAAGGALGTILRYQTGPALTALVGMTQPWATLFINTTGSFAMGLFTALTAAGGRWPVPAEIRGFLLVGLCGGYTTFSSFSVQTLMLIQSGSSGRAVVSAAGSIVLCTLAAWLGSNLPLVMPSWPKT